MSEKSFFDGYSKDKNERAVYQLALTALGPTYSFNVNNPVSLIDLLGLENAQIVVTTAIRPPFAQSGVKTIHQIVVSDHGKLISHFDFIGTTTFTLPIIGPVATDPGVGSFNEGASGDYPDVTVSMDGTAQSYFLQFTPLKIKYEYEIDLNFCSRKGHLSGYNHRFPSYTVSVNGKPVYDFQQVLFTPGLLGQEPAEPNVDFKF